MYRFAEHDTSEKIKLIILYCYNNIYVKYFFLICAPVKLLNYYL